jgi:hypothetical protein
LNWKKLLAIDSRIIYLLVGLALLIPLIKPLGLPIEISSNSLDFYNYLKGIPEDSIVFFDLAFRETGQAEFGPSVLASFEMLIKQGVKIVVGGQWEQAPFFMQKELEKRGESFGAQYGVDWVNIGYKPGGTATWRVIIEDFWKGAAGVDCKGTKFEDIELMERVEKLDEDTFAAIIIWQAGTPGADTWMTYTPEVPLLSAQMGGGVASSVRYLKSGQMQAILGGMRGAAEFEKLTGCLGEAIGLLDAQGLAILIIIAFVVLGNIAWFMSKKQEGHQA